MLVGIVWWTDASGMRSNSCPCVKAYAGLAGEVLQGYKRLSLARKQGIPSKQL